MANIVMTMMWPHLAYCGCHQTRNLGIREKCTGQGCPKSHICPTLSEAEVTRFCLRQKGNSESLKFSVGVIPGHVSGCQVGLGAGITVLYFAVIQNQGKSTTVWTFALTLVPHNYPVSNL